MIVKLFGGPYSGETMHLPQGVRAFVVRHKQETEVIDSPQVRPGTFVKDLSVQAVVGEYRVYDTDLTHVRMIWFDPADMEEAKKAASKDERHAAQDLLRALREARLAGTEAAREEGMRKAAAIQAHWEKNMSDTMRAKLAEAAAQARAETESGAHFASSDEERWAT